jgi:hypothetical protein
MSLVSASGFITGVKEYLYRGTQEMPLVLILTSLLFVITTGSIAHTSLLFGLTILMPLYGFFLRTIGGFFLSLLSKENQAGWTCSSGDTCNIVRPYEYPSAQSAGGIVPSYWILAIPFYFGYILMNAYETYYAPIRKDSNPVNIEKRNTQALFLAVASIFLFILLLGVRFTFMGDCEGKGLMGKILSIFVFGSSAFVIGTGVYSLSKLCGARSSDLFGVLSQILPQSATDTRPVVCSAS